MPFAAFIPLIQAVIGGAQSSAGNRRAREAQAKMEQMQKLNYQQSQSINDYYREALRRYAVSPYQTASYKNDIQNIDQNVNMGLSSLQDRRAGVSGVNKLLSLSNDAKLKAGVNAENSQNQKFNQLGGAAGMQAQENRMAYNENVKYPFEQMYNLLGSKAAGGNQIMNAGLQNIFQGLSNASMFGKEDYKIGGNKASGSAYGNIPSSYSTYLNNRSYFNKKNGTS